MLNIKPIFKIGAVLSSSVVTCNVHATSVLDKWRNENVDRAVKMYAIMMENPNCLEIKKQFASHYNVKTNGKGAPPGPGSTEIFMNWLAENPGAQDILNDILKAEAAEAEAAEAAEEDKKRFSRWLRSEGGRSAKELDRLAKAAPAAPAASEVSFVNLAWNFHAKYTFEASKESLLTQEGIAAGQTAGIENRGNACYLNSLLQLLYRTPFGNGVLSYPGDNLLIRGLQCFFMSMGQLNTISSQHAESFVKEWVVPLVKHHGISVENQNDPSEIMCHLFNAVEKVIPGGKGLMDCFSFSIKQIISNGAGEKETTSLKESVLKLPFSPKRLASREPIELVGMVADFFASETMADGRQKRFVMENCPPCLLVQVNRFQFDRSTGIASKISNPVIAPGELDMSQFSDGAVGPIKYGLKGAIYHKGNALNNGHFIACVWEEDGWVIYNDDARVEEGNPQFDRFLGGATPYIFLYCQEQSLEESRGPSRPLRSALPDLGPRRPLTNSEPWRLLPDLGPRRPLTNLKPLRPLTNLKPLRPLPDSEPLRPSKAKFQPIIMPGLGNIGASCGFNVALQLLAKINPIVAALKTYNGENPAMKKLGDFYRECEETGPSENVDAGKMHDVLEKGICPISGLRLTLGSSAGGLDAFDCAEQLFSGLGKIFKEEKRDDPTLGCLSQILIPVKGSSIVENLKDLFAGRDDHIVPEYLLLDISSLLEKGKPLGMPLTLDCEELFPQREEKIKPKGVAELKAVAFLEKFNKFTEGKKQEVGHWIVAIWGDDGQWRLYDDDQVNPIFSDDIQRIVNKDPDIITRYCSGHKNTKARILLYGPSSKK
jgi:ubiquitin C-terminal hydrolase